VSWQRIDQLMGEIYATPKDVLAKAKAAVGGTMYGPNIDLSGDRHE